jgi:cobyrinic acid a,c-diamide synthase
MSSFIFTQPMKIKEEVIKGFVVAGTTSGSGKTTIALGFMAALSRRGFRVAPFKVGPDFIDPGHHTRIAGTVSRNIDGWMLSEKYNINCFARHTKTADVAVIEGVMGLFDGRDGKSEAGSTAEMAKKLKLPVLLVVNARSMARSAAALVQGFENFDRELSFAGVIFNNVGSDRHLQYLNEALHNHVRMPIIGGIPRYDNVTIPERHLGLITDAEHTLTEDRISLLAALVEDNIDLDAFLFGLNENSVNRDFPISMNLNGDMDRRSSEAVRIGVAQDNAFCFYYQDNLDLLTEAGGQIVYFSPLKDTSLPPELDGLYLGGGYPELFTSQLAQNHQLRDGIKRLSEAGMPIYGECGGMMYLGRAISDLDGVRYPMTACFPLETRMLPRLKSLGYREVRLVKDNLLGKSGDAIRGHEFHYSEINSEPDGTDKVYSVSGRGAGNHYLEGYRIKNTLGSYVHLHFGSCPSVCTTFVDSCLGFKRERKSVR